MRHAVRFSPILAAAPASVEAFATVWTAVAAVARVQHGGEYPVSPL